MEKEEIMINLKVLENLQKDQNLFREDNILTSNQFLLFPKLFVDGIVKIIEMRQLKR